MASIINAHTTNGLVLTSDTSGEIQFQNNGTTIATVSSTGLSASNISATDKLAMPQWTSATRPSSPSQGDLGFNTTTGYPEWYDTGSAGWVQINKGAPYNVSYLVIAGGGGGGSHAGSGGGAGGYRNSYASEASGADSSTETPFQALAGTTYTITVGAGGSAVVNNQGNQGGNSSISGSGISTITSLGGGKGRGQATTGTGFSGGSGSGGAGSSGTSAGGAGTAGQGYAGGSNSNNWGTGGGGGAGAVGGNGSGSNAGNGGAGLNSQITGSNVTRAGGGGGSSQTGTHGTGGAGGGGNGSLNGATAGAANRGAGGGGGHGSTAASGAGGSGVVILRMPTANYSGTQSGATVTTSGSDTILTFNSSGSYTG
jgi:hypothetical protein